MQRVACSLFAVAALWAVGGACSARAAPPEEIVVTAERRERPLAHAPLSAVVASGADLRRSGVESTQDLPFRTPGLAFSTNTVLGQPYLRGVGSDLITAGAESSVATLVDGVYRTRPVASIQEFFDVERVEVLMGPQGALFGRNATGGLIHVVTRDPEPGVAAEGDVSYGKFDAVRVRGALNLPLAGERAVLHIAGLRTRRDGFTRELSSGERLDDEDLSALRGKLLLRPHERLSLLLSGDTATDHGTRNLVVKVVEPFAGSPAFGLGGSIPADPRAVRLDSPTRADVHAWGGSAKLQWEGERFDLSSLTAFRRSDFDERLDLDGTDVPFASNAPAEDSSAWTEELQARSRGGGPVEWLAGAFYLYEDVSQALDVSLPLFGLRDQPGGSVRTDALGLYANGAWSPLDWLRVSAGLRYSRDWREIRFSEFLNGALVAAFERDIDQDAWTPRFVVEIGPREPWLLYASAARGFKAGGFNTNVAQDTPFAPETLWAFEAGARVMACDGRLRAHLAGFAYLYDEIQLNVVAPASTIPFPLVRNAGKATLYGAELELELEPLDGVQLDFALALLHAEFDDLLAVNPNDLASDPDQSGNRLPHAPGASLWVGAQYRAELGRFGALTPRLEYHYQSRLYFDVFEDPFSSQQAYGVLNAYLRYDLPGERTSLALFGRNLTDELYAHSGVRLDGAIGNLFRWSPPRTYGVEAQLRF